MVSIHSQDRHGRLIALRFINTTKSKVRAKVEHVFLVIKQIFERANVRSCGLAKNAQGIKEPSC